jgi:hypothetical protein
MARALAASSGLYRSRSTGAAIAVLIRGASSAGLSGPFWEVRYFRYRRYLAGQGPVRGSGKG